MKIAHLRNRLLILSTIEDRMEPLNDDELRVLMEEANDCIEELLESINLAEERFDDLEEEEDEEAEQEADDSDPEDEEEED